MFRSSSVSRGSLIQTPDAASERKEAWIAKHVAPLALVLATLALLLFWVWIQGAEQRAVRNLPADQRMELYERTLANLESLCGNAHPEALTEYCREQAEFILEFPECDRACSILANRQLPKARR